MFEKAASNSYSARNTAKPVNFYCAAPSARSVLYLAGDFNGWIQLLHPMRLHRREDGWWFIEVPLTHGHHQYHFLVDDQPVLDPQGAGIARNERNERVSPAGSKLINFSGNNYTRCSVGMGCKRGPISKRLQGLREKTVNKLKHNQSN